MKRVLAVVAAVVLVSASALACAAMTGQDCSDHSCCQTNSQSRAKCCSLTTPAPEPKPAALSNVKITPAEPPPMRDAGYRAADFEARGVAAPPHAVPAALYLSYRSLRL